MSGASSGRAGEASEGGSAGAAAAEGGVAGQPVLGGAGPHAAGAAGANAAGHAGEAAEPAPFAAPYGAIYVAPIVGVDTRFPESARWESGKLVNWISNLDQGHEHDIGSAQNLDTGISGDAVQWGRWADGTLGGDDGAIVLNDKQGFHYAIGSLTATLPTSGTAEYEVVGYTPVTVGDGTVATGLVAANATAAFGATTKVGVTINLTIDGTSYVVVTTGTFVTPSTSELETWDAEQPARLAGIPLEPSQGICADGCARSLQGFFAGADASHLALVVHLFDGAGGSATSISSVIVLKKK